MTERIDTKALLEKWGKTREFDGTYPIPLSEWWDALTQEVAEHEADRTRLEQWEAEAQDKAHPKVRPMTHLENAYMDLEKKLATAQARIEALEEKCHLTKDVWEAAEREVVELRARIAALGKEPAGLGPLDAGLILLADGGQSVLLPKMDDDQDAPGHVILLTALAARLTDKSFVDDCLEWLAEYVKRTKLSDTALAAKEETEDG